MGSNHQFSLVNVSIFYHCYMLTAAYTQCVVRSGFYDMSNEVVPTYNVTIH